MWNQVSIVKVARPEKTLLRAEMQEHASRHCT